MVIRAKSTTDLGERVIRIGALRSSLGGIALDRYGFRHQTCAAAALEAFEQATLAVTAHRPGIGDALEAALRVDPNMVAALCLSGFCNVILARPETMALARTTCERAVMAVEFNDDASADEMALLRALVVAVQGYGLHAADVLDEHIMNASAPLLMVKLSHALRFMAGDQAGMRRTTHHILSSGATDQPGYGFILGMHAFALEETGAYAEALRMGIDAVEREPTDSWGMHAVAHVCEMTGRSRVGLSWLRATEDRWMRCNNFAGHMAWHAALFLLEQRDHAGAIALYDAAVRASRSEDFRDFANAGSLLFRMCQAGVDVGDRWIELADISRRRRHQAGLVFARLHDMVVLAAVGDHESCRNTLHALQNMALTGEGEQARVALHTGVALGRIILALTEGSMKGSMAADEPSIETLTTRLRMMGGSNAQRDLFVRILASEAIRRRDRAALSEIMAVRRQTKRVDSFWGRVKSEWFPT